MASPPGEGRVRGNSSPWDPRGRFRPDMHDCSIRLRKVFTLTPSPLPEGSGFPSSSTGISTNLVGRRENTRLGHCPTASFGQSEQTTSFNRSRLGLRLARRLSTCKFLKNCCRAQARWSRTCGFLGKTRSEMMGNLSPEGEGKLLTVLLVLFRRPLRVFGCDGVGIFPSPTVIKKEVSRQYGVVPLGLAEGVRERYYAISV